MFLARVDGIFWLLSPCSYLTSPIYSAPIYHLARMYLLLSTYHLPPMYLLSYQQHRTSAWLEWIDVSRELLPLLLPLLTPPCAAQASTCALIHPHPPASTGTRTLHKHLTHAHIFDDGERRGLAAMPKLGLLHRWRRRAREAKGGAALQPPYRAAVHKLTRWR